MESYLNGIITKYYEKIYDIIDKNKIKVKKNIQSKNFIQLYIDKLYQIKLLYDNEEILLNYPEIFLLLDLDTNKKYTLFKKCNDIYYLEILPGNLQNQDPKFLEEEKNSEKNKNSYKNNK